MNQFLTHLSEPLSHLNLLVFDNCSQNLAFNVHKDEVAKKIKSFQICRCNKTTDTTLLPLKYGTELNNMNSIEIMNIKSDIFENW